ncbi:phosphoglucosamine mutase [Methanolapillus millepedarum]|uniref:Phosphoglucosamine mutase n=1 Tax=Methanolapillus millepedarum TaxID=3028296 RepID=A0AA96ZUQ7_9EURY|nr:Phosphoglucosamine mutase [Methanosarcinaceae archaeon Ac7]
MSLFGTNGVRALANKELTPEMALKLSQSFGAFLISRSHKKTPAVAVGTDTRVTGSMLKCAVISGLLSSGIRVIDLGIAPTPSLQYYVKNATVDAGLVVTASHNPREYNGIKLIAGDGTEFSHEDESVVEEIYNSGKFMYADWSKTGELLSDSNANDLYVNGILSQIDQNAISGRKLRVVVDTGSGAGSLTLPVLLQKLGCQVLTVGAQPDGTFPWRNPEPVVESLGEMSVLIRMFGGDLGIAQDGDADRAVFMDENGEFIDEEIMLAVIGKFMLQREKENPKNNAGKTNGSGIGPVVTTVSTSNRLTDIAKEAGVDILYTKVGSIDVGRKMMETCAVYGGEGNGGMIFPNHQICRDGAMAAAFVLESMIKNNVKASEFKQIVPEYFNTKTKIKTTPKDPKSVMETLTKTILSPESKKEIGYVDADTIDGVKLHFKTGWLLIRPSGTEPIVRVVAESKTKEEAEKFLKIGEELVLKSLGTSNH